MRRERKGKGATKRAGRGAAKRVGKKSTKKATKKAAKKKTAGSAAKKKAARQAAKRKAAKRASSEAKKSAKKAKKSAKKRAPQATRKPAAAPAGRAAATPEQMVELVARYVSAFNRGDVEAILALYHPRATMEDPVGYTPARGHRAIGTVYQGGFRQGVTIVLDGAIRCAGGSVAFPVVARTPQATLQSVNVFDLSPDGRIERMRAYWGPYNVVGEIAVRG